MTYDSTALLGPTTWLATTSGAQAYAYPVDGCGTNDDCTSIYQASSTHTAVTSSMSLSKSTSSFSSLLSVDGFGELNEAQIGTIPHHDRFGEWRLGFSLCRSQVTTFEAFVDEGKAIEGLVDSGSRQFSLETLGVRRPRGIDLENQQVDRI
jgi:hypothetical protein